MSDRQLMRFNFPSSEHRGRRIAVLDGGSIAHIYEDGNYDVGPIRNNSNWKDKLIAASVVGLTLLGIKVLVSKLWLNSQEMTTIMAQATQSPPHNYDEINHKILSSIQQTLMDLTVNISHLARVNQKLLELSVNTPQMTNIDQKLMELSAGVSQIANIDQKFTDINSNLSAISSVIQGPTLKDSSLTQCIWAAGGKAASGTAWLVKTGSVKTWDYLQSFRK